MKKVLTLLVCITAIFAACNTEPNATENSTNTTDKIASKVEVENNKLQKQTTTAKKSEQQKVTNKKEVTGSGKIKWVNIEEVQKLVKQQPKKILIDAYTDWCGWCKRMDKNTFANPVIAKYVNDNFYAVKLNAETKETLNFKGKDYEFKKGKKRGHNTLAKEFLKGRMSYPTISFLDENLELINAFPGYKTPQHFDALMNYISQNKFDKMGFTQYKSSFQSAIPEAPKNLATTKGKTNTTIKKTISSKPVTKRSKLKNVITKPGKVNISPKKNNQNTRNNNKGNK